MELQRLGANFAKIAKSIDNKLDFLPYTFPRKILRSTICIIGIPFLVIAVIVLRDWSSARDKDISNNKVSHSNIEEGDELSFTFKDEESYQFIKDGFHSSGPDGEGYYVNGFRMPENTDKDWL